MHILNATLLGLLTGISGTGIGGLWVLSRTGSIREQGWLLGFSGGIMFTVVLFDLWPEAWHFGGLWTMLAGTAAGMLLVHYFDRFLRFFPWYQKREWARVTRVGILLGVGIGTHNFPEGVALGTTYIANTAIGHWLGLALLMALHNIPEGMVMASAFKLGKVRPVKILLSLILVEIPMAFGGTVGAFLGSISPEMTSISLGFAGGAMFLLVLQELLPLARRLASIFHVGSGFAVGFAIGILLVRLV